MQDGVISYEEFKSAMAGWLAPQLGGTKRKAAAAPSSPVVRLACKSGLLWHTGIAAPCLLAQSRRRIQKDIGAFFKQFEVVDIETAVAQAAQAAGDSSEDADDFADMDPVTALAAKSVTPEQRVAALKEAAAKGSNQQLDLALSMLSGSSPEQLVQAAKQLSEVVSIVNFFHGPSVNRIVANEITTLYRAMWYKDVTTKLVAALNPALNLGSTQQASAMHEQLLVYTLKTLYHLILGPRLTAADANDPMHPKNCHKAAKAVFVLKSTPGTSPTDPTGLRWALWHMSNNPSAQVRMWAVKVISAVVAFPFDGERNQFRLEALKPANVGGLGLVHVCLERLALSGSAHEDVGVIAEVLHLLGILLGRTHTHPGDAADLHPSDLALIGGELLVGAVVQPLRDPVIAKSPDHALVYMHAVSALAYLLPYIDLLKEASIVELLVQLASVEVGEGATGDISVASGAAALCAREALRAIAIASRLQEGRGAAVLVAKTSLLTNVIVPVLSSPVDSSLKMACLQVLRSVLNTSMEVASPVLATRGVLQGVVRCLEHEDITDARAAHLVKDIAALGSSSAQELIKAGAPRALCMALGRFQKHDEVMAEVFAFTGPSFNFNLAITSLQALKNILAAGASSAAGNPFLPHFGMELVSVARSVISAALLYRRAGIVQCKTLEALTAMYTGEAAAGGTRNLVPRRMHEVLSLLTDLMFQQLHTQHKAAADAGNTVSGSVAAAIAALFKEYQSTQSQLEMVFTEAEKRLRMGPAFASTQSVSLVQYAQKHASSDLLSAELHVPIPVVVTIQNMPEHTYTVDMVPQQISFELMRADINSHFGAGGSLLLGFEDPETGAVTAMNSNADLRTALERFKSVPGAKHFSIVAAPGQGKVLHLVPLGGEHLERNFNRVFSEFNKRYSPDRLLDKKGVGAVYQEFKRLGKAEMTVEEFEAAMFHQGMRDSELIRTYFRGFDSDGSGTISLEECVLGLATLTKGSLHTKLRVAFDAFDEDSNGYIDVHELTRLVRFSSGFSHEASQAEAIRLMQTVDANSDGKLDFSEFAAAVQHQPAIIKKFHP